MKKKKVIIIVVIVLILILIPAYLVYASFHGSIIKKYMVTKEAKAYVSKHFNEEDFVVSKARYDFKLCGYYCNVQSKTSRDTRFSVFKRSKGEMDDNYDLCVNRKESTIGRLSRELDEWSDKTLKKAYPHKTDLVMCDFYGGEEFDLDKFTLDMELDMSNLPHPIEVNIWTETEKESPTWKELGERLRELVKITDKLGVYPEYFSMWLEYKESDMEGADKAKLHSTVQVFEVPREVIEGEGLDEYLEKEKIRVENEIREMQEQEFLNEKYAQEKSAQEKFAQEASTQDE